MKVEEKYEDVLHHIESCVIQHYRDNPNLKDYDVSLVYEALHAYYRRESGGIPQKPHKLNEARAQMFDDIKDILQLRLDTATANQLELLDEDKPNEVHTLCFKRLLQSVKHWTTRGVRGYLDFIIKHV